MGKRTIIVSDITDQEIPTGEYAKITMELESRPNIKFVLEVNVGEIPTEFIQRAQMNKKPGRQTDEREPDGYRDIGGGKVGSTSR